MDDKSYLQLSSVCSYKNQYLCFMRDLDLLCSIDKNNGATKALCFLPEAKTNRLFDKILLWRDYVCLIPLHAEKVYLYNLADGKLESIDIPEASSVKYFKFFTGCLNEDNLYLIGCYYPAVIKIDLINRTVKKIEIYKEVIGNTGSAQGPFTRKSIVKKDNDLYVASAKSNQVIRIHLQDDTYSYQNVGEAANRYYGIAWDGEAFWLSTFDGKKLIRWIPDRLAEEINIAEFYEEETNFSRILCWNGKVYLLSLESAYSLEYDYEEKKGKILETGPEPFCEELCGEMIYQFKDGKIHIMGERERIISPDLSGIYEAISTSGNKWKYYSEESNTFGLDSFLDQLCRG